MNYVAVSALSHDGLLRDHNEDSLVAGPWTLCATTTTNPQTLVFPHRGSVVVAVADGLGGHPAGELASTLVVQELAHLGPDLGDERAVRAALDGCNKVVYDAARQDPDRTAMGTTVAGVVVTAKSVHVFNVGDSRVYGVQGSTLRRLSVDDSPALAPGQTHTVIVTQTLGGHPAYTPVHAHVRTLPHGELTRMLVCSDGLSDVVEEDVILWALRQHEDGGRASFELWKAAIDGGGPDNITLAVVDIEQDAAG